MMAKKTTVALVSDSGRVQDFEFSHAERLLRMPRSGWSVPQDSKYEFTDNALHRRTTARRDNEE